MSTNIYSPAQKEAVNDRYQSVSGSTIASGVDGSQSPQKGGVPRIPWELRENLIPISITSGVIFTGGCIIPLVLYYALRYGAHTSLGIALTIPSVIYGLPTTLTLITRSWSLLRRGSTTRPIGAGKRHLDFFHYVYIIIFAASTAMISAGSGLAWGEDIATAERALRIVAMSLSLILIVTCSQMAAVFGIISVAPNSKYPFRISSMTKGMKARPAIYTIIEDVVAVDGKKGTEYRRQVDERYRFSQDIRSLLLWVDGVWGISGLIVGIAVIIVIWTVNNANVSWAIGWGVPWVWAGLFAWITTMKTKKALKKENERYMGVQ